MELKNKYQYTYFIHTFLINQNKYNKYLLKLLKDERFELRIFQKEKDLELYSYFLPEMRNFLFKTFDLSKERLKKMEELPLETRAAILSAYPCITFEYNLKKDLQGKTVDDNSIFFKIQKIGVVCFNTGICFLYIKTNIEGSNKFVDVLNFNYKFRDINQEYSDLRNYDNIKLQESYFSDIKEIKEFIAEITSNMIPVSVSNEIRVHLSENKSFYIENGVVSDLYPNYVSCLKVYTVEDDSKVTSNTDISVVYGSESYFSVKVVTSNNHSVVGASVEFTINGKAINATTDNEGIAKLEINEVPGNYVVATSYNNQYYLNNVSVMLDLQNCKVVSKNIAVDYAGESYFTAKLVSSDGKVAVGGQSVIFVINGKTLTVKTDKNGMAKIKITEVPFVSQPLPFNNGETVVGATSLIDINEENESRLSVLDTGVNLQELVDGLNALGVMPRDLISILQAIKASGALQADIEVI